MTASRYEAARQPRLPGEVSVVNAGLPLFAEAVASQGRPAVQLDWRIPGGGDPAVVAALRRLSGPKTAVIDAANAEVYRRLDKGVPQATAVRPAAEVIPALAGEPLILHSGPAIDYGRACDPLRRSMRAAVVAEGWAASTEQADRRLASGRVRTDSANAHRVVVPMATAMGPRTPVWVVELARSGDHGLRPGRAGLRGRGLVREGQPGGRRAAGAAARRGRPGAGRRARGVPAR